MVSMPSGFIITPSLSRAVSVDLQFKPSVGLLARKVDKLGADIRSFREPLRRIVKEVMIPSIRTNFDVGGRPAWAPLASSTLEKKRTSQILVETGALRRQMGFINTWTFDREKAMIVDLPQKVWYGKVHQAGHGSVEMFDDPVTGKTVNIGDDGAIPARPFVVVQPEDIEEMERIMSEWVGERVRKAGLA